MKKFLFIALIFPFFLNAQTSNWQENPLSERAFIQNNGQFDGRNWQDGNPIEYASKQGGWYTFFGKN